MRAHLTLNIFMLDKFVVLRVCKKRFCNIEKIFHTKNAYFQKFVNDRCVREILLHKI